MPAGLTLCLSNRSCFGREADSLEGPLTGSLKPVGGESAASAASSFSSVELRSRCSRSALGGRTAGLRGDAALRFDAALAGDAALRFDALLPGDAAQRFDALLPGDDAPRFDALLPGDDAPRFDALLPGDAAPRSSRGAALRCR